MTTGRTTYDPTNDLIEAFIKASSKPMNRAQRRALELRRPWLELTSPGLLALLDRVSLRSVRSARRVARLRKDLTFVYHEAKKMGLLP